MLEPQKKVFVAQKRSKKISPWNCVTLDHTIYVLLLLLFFNTLCAGLWIKYMWWIEEPIGASRAWAYLLSATIISSFLQLVQPCGTLMVFERYVFAKITLQWGPDEVHTSHQHHRPILR